MKTTQWFDKFKEMLDREETQHFDVHKATVAIQFKSPNGSIELHQWEYKDSKAENLKVTL